MAICVLVLAERDHADQLNEQLKAAETPLTRCELIQPATNSETQPERTASEANGNGKPLQSIDIDSIERLSPKLTRSRRQKLMAVWLLPFGFILGIAITLSTDMDTFASYGSLGASVIGGLLGLVSGWMGSYAAAISVKIPNAEDVRILRNRHEQGQWLLLLETPMGIDLPESRSLRILPRAAMLMAMSKMNGAPFCLGAANPKGLLPIFKSRPPKGAIAGEALVPHMRAMAAIEAAKP